jgi:hypothetical protein
MAKMTASSRQRMLIRQAMVETTIKEMLGDKGFDKTKTKAFPPATNWSALIAERMRAEILDEAVHLSMQQVNGLLQQAHESKGLKAFDEDIANEVWTRLCRSELDEEPEMAMPEPSRLVTAQALDPLAVKRRDEAIAEMKRRTEA